ncbi:hypothetical protein NW762_001027 [Fusarium torreyae]|uniref:Uncharacterized protein n=1 Tax=Fusarium torreyae TaxID=1237075 RepID=A0A9W8VR97_9HYPO|nr:hypothetical protein NW762_001027 [Fusarium torreyae]
MAAPLTPPLGSVSGPGASAVYSTPGMPPQYRVALGLDLDGYVTPDIEEVYRLHAVQNGAAIAVPTTTDNVYSHRSTQRYKRKPFISHYWDCRMKGRPPGTPKSDDPNKKKRKRKARQRDLCDVKIKITEYFPGAQLELENSVDVVDQRLWTIQRVNGNGGNGKGDGVAGPHKHTLERSDEIKKNSVQRYLAKQRDLKKAKKTPIRKATGAALVTVKKHAKENDLKLYAAFPSLNVYG